MKNKMKLFLWSIYTLTIISLTTQAQTNVSGGIYTNTTWTLANSPYIVVDTVVVFPGVTLTIEPGVIVKFENNKRLEIREARIIANGTNSDSITFTSNALAPNPGIWSGLYLNSCTITSEFNYCVFQYADMGLYLYYATGGIIAKNSNFINNNIGLKEFGWYGYTLIDTCNFTYNTCGLSNVALTTLNYCNISNNQTGLEAYTGTTSSRNKIANCTIDSNSVDGLTTLFGDTVINCIIRYNGTGIRTETDGYFYGRYCTISMNTIENNNIGIWMGSYTDIIHCNKICNNTMYNLYYGATSGDNTDISYNYWCTTDSAIVASTVYDGYDNISLSLAQFMPIDTLQCYLSTTAQNSPDADFTCTVDSFSYPNCCISFIDLSTDTPTTWFWSHGDGNDYSAQTHSHCYNYQGIYQVCLMVTNAFGSDTLCKDAYIIVDSTGCYCGSDSILTGLSEKYLNTRNVVPYPNPFYHSTTITFRNSKKEKHTLTLYNSLGQLVRQIDNISNGQIIIKRDNLSNGLYFFQLQNVRQVVATGKLMIE
ncbi:MAG: T9SS type A sorting domain-containing protein [Bacteroidota bacterium]